MIYKALINISKKSPDLFFIIQNTTFEVLESHSQIKTAAMTFDKTSKKFKVILIKDFIEGMDLLSLSALIEHELLHLVLRHVSFGESFPNKRLANIAFDSIINDIGFFFKDRKKLDERLQKGVFLSDLNLKYNLSLNTIEHDSKHIYSALEKVINDTEKNGLESFDDHPCDAESIDAELKDFFKEKQKELEKFISAKVIGKGSALFKSFIDRIEREKRDKTFFSALNQFISSQKTASYKSSLKRPSKRFTGSPVGKIRLKTKKVRLLLDVSGSMLDDQTILKLKKSISLCVNNGFFVDLVYGDTKKIGEFKNINSRFDFNQIGGGGGTDLRFMFSDLAESSKYDVNLVVTDLYINDHDLDQAKKRNTLILCTETIKHKTLKTIFI